MSLPDETTLPSVVHTMTPSLQPEDYTIAWICALPIEVLAATFMLDEVHEGSFPTRFGDDNDYNPGRIGVHNVVIVGLPDKSAGRVSAANLVSELRGTFRELRYGLMVGIGAGVPGTELNPDIRLGDVVIAAPSDSSNNASGVIGYETGKETDDGFVDTGWHPPTNRRLRNAFANIRNTAQFHGIERFPRHLKAFQSRATGRSFGHPGIATDHLHTPESNAKSGPHQIVIRKQRDSLDPIAHYGLVASGDKVVKTANFRATLRDKYNIICIETEAAGLIDTLPVAVIRGISDYADSYKNDDWKPYAAGTASAYAKELLYRIGAEVGTNPPRAHESANFVQDYVQDYESNKTKKLGISGPDPASEDSLHKHPSLTESAANLFHDLGRGSRYIADSKHFWGHLTMDSLEIYRRIYTALFADKKSLIPLALKEGLYSLDASASWRLVVDDTFTALKTHFPIIHKNIGLAFIYVLHMRRDTNYNLERNRRGHARFSTERVEIISKFDEWILCSCPCGSTWNFVSDEGLQEGQKNNRPCLVAKWLRSNLVERVVSEIFPSQLQTGHDFYMKTFKNWMLIEYDMDN